MSLQSEKQPPLTPEQYLEAERKAEYKSEYFNGETFAMAGASRRHNLITGNVAATIYRQIRKRPFEAYISNMRLKVSESGLYTYPDVVVVCETPEFDDEHHDTLLNPSLIVEVLSETTEAYDRGKKFESYRTIASLSDYLLMAQDKRRIEHYVRQQENRWLFSEYKDPKAVFRIAAPDCEIRLEEVYEKIEW
jgi:Uma2 family endonuclease